LTPARAAASGDTAFRGACAADPLAARLRRREPSRTRMLCAVPRASVC